MFNDRARILSSQAARHKRQRAILDALKAGPCVDCGQTYPPCVMDFDHVRGVKLRSVGQLVDASISKLMAEIEKCDLVCSNCHRIRTFHRVQS